MAHVFCRLWLLVVELRVWDPKLCYLTVAHFRALHVKEQARGSFIFKDIEVCFFRKCVINKFVL